MSTNLDPIINPTPQTTEPTIAQTPTVPGAADVARAADVAEGTVPTPEPADEPLSIPEFLKRPAVADVADDPTVVRAKPIPPLSVAEAPTRRYTTKRRQTRSLDDTATQLLPNSSALWDAVEDARRPVASPEKPARPSRLRTAALVCAVAMVSFVAGGVFTRLSSQVPLLFSEKPVSTESVASYVEKPQQQVVEQEQTESEPEPEPEPEYDETQVTEDQQTTDGNTWEWNFDPEGNNRVTYNNNDDLVTIDYNGYSLTVPMGELMGYDQSYPTGNGYTTQSPTTRDYSYNYNYDYDRYDQQQDSYGWNYRQQDGGGWYGGYSA